MARYEAGETLASIARTYDCSPPAISYVVSRSRSRGSDTAEQPQPASIADAQLVKSGPAEAGGSPPKPREDAVSEAASRVNGNAPPAPVSSEAVQRPTGNAAADRGDHHSPAAAHHGTRVQDDERQALPARPAAVTSPPRTPAANGDHRRTLHLSLGQPGNGNGASPATTPMPDRAVLGSSAGHQSANPPFPQSSPAAGGQPSEVPAPRHQEPVAQRQDANGTHRKDNGSYIDNELRARVSDDINAFLSAFDAALLNDTQENRSALREATDRLLRAGARTRIELERLEARIPLPVRDGGTRGEPAWRQR